MSIPKARPTTGKPGGRQPGTILILGEIGLLRIIIPEAAVYEIRRNLGEKLPDALPAYEAFLKALSVSVHRPDAADLRKAEPYCHAKDVPIMAAALGSGATLLVTHNSRHFKSTDRLQVVRPQKLVEDARAWMAKFGE